MLKCNQAGCERPASFRFTWPGREEAGVCREHSVTVKNVASAMGFYLQLISLEEPRPEVPPPGRK